MASSASPQNREDENNSSNIKTLDNFELSGIALYGRNRPAPSPSQIRNSITICMTVDDEVITLPEGLYRRFEAQEIGWRTEVKIDDGHAFLYCTLLERQPENPSSYRRVENYAFRIPLCLIHAARDRDYGGVLNLIIERAQRSGGQEQYFYVLSRSFRNFKFDESLIEMKEEEEDKIMDEKRYGYFTGRCSFAILLRFTEIILQLLRDCVRSVVRANEHHHRLFLRNKTKLII